jgi:hypothetical protein
MLLLCKTFPRAQLCGLKSKNSIYHNYVIMDPYKCLYVIKSMMIITNYILNTRNSLKNIKKYIKIKHMHQCDLCRKHRGPKRCIFQIFFSYHFYSKFNVFTFCVFTFFQIYNANVTYRILHHIKIRGQNRRQNVSSSKNTSTVQGKTTRS